MLTPNQPNHPTAGDSTLPHRQAKTGYKLCGSFKTVEREKSLAVTITFGDSGGIVSIFISCSRLLLLSTFVATSR